jgi:hypothetical protein
MVHEILTNIVYFFADPSRKGHFISIERSTGCFRSHPSEWKRRKHENASMGAPVLKGKCGRSRKSRNGPSRIRKKGHGGFRESEIPCRGLADAPGRRGSATDAWGKFSTQL